MPHGTSERQCGCGGGTGCTGLIGGSRPCCEYSRRLHPSEGIGRLRPSLVLRPGQAVGLLVGVEHIGLSAASHRSTFRSSDSLGRCLTKTPPGPRERHPHTELALAPDAG